VKPSDDFFFRGALAASLYAAIGIFDELGFSLRLNYHPNL